MTDRIDAIAVLRTVVDMASKAEVLGNILTKVRTIDESDLQTLNRLLDERAAVVKLFEKNHIKHRPRDWSYKSSFIEALSELEGKIL